jgi:hypothetical protein
MITHAAAVERLTGKPATRAKRKPRLRQTEAQLKSATLAALRCLPSVHVLRMNAGKRPAEYKGKTRMIALGEAGTPDLLVMLPGGMCMWLELKTMVGKVSDTQRAWHERALQLGHRTHVCRSVDDVMFLVREALAGARRVANEYGIAQVRAGGQP